LGGWHAAEPAAALPGLLHQQNPVETHFDFMSFAVPSGLFCRMFRVMACSVNEFPIFKPVWR